MKIKQRDLVLISFPFTDLKERKVRPALILSNDELNDKSDDCLMVPLTGVIKEVPYSVLISQTNLAEGRLIKDSRIRIDKIFSIGKKQIHKIIGVLDSATFDKVKKEFSSLI